MTNRPIILVVEDSATQAKEISANLRRHGMDVVIAEDGPEALRAVDEYQPALVVLDINLPSMDGYQVCRRIKRDPNTAHIPVIMLTSADSSDAALRGLEAGADDYIPKDVFATENLLNTLHSFNLKGEEG